MSQTELPEWKLRQALSHRIFPIEDELQPGAIELVSSPERRLELCIDYFKSPQPELYYPCKSYCVAVIYARLLNRCFGVDFFAVLNDPELLFGNDPYFVRYSDDRAFYDAILSKISLDFDESIYQVERTISFFKREFLIGEAYEHWLSRV
ncbi:MAG: hypothetical protein P4M08_10220 [Oligoflexia bacterium]|nr:hypothetical protein [Oligoflexia bacterium]